MVFMKATFKLAALALLGAASCSGTNASELRGGDIMSTIKKDYAAEDENLVNEVDNTFPTGYLEEKDLGAWKMKYEELASGGEKASITAEGSDGDGDDDDEDLGIWKDSQASDESSFVGWTYHRVGNGGCRNKDGKKYPIIWWKNVGTYKDCRSICVRRLSSGNGNVAYRLGYAYSTSAKQCYCYYGGNHKPLRKPAGAAGSNLTYSGTGSIAKTGEASGYVCYKFVGLEN